MRHWALPDAGTVGDWLRRQGEKGAAALEQISRKLIASCFVAGEEATLDVDATEIEAEKQDAQWTYHHLQGYMPRVGYGDGVCVGHQVREGNESPGGIWEFAWHGEGALPTGEKVYFRSDSAAYQAEGDPPLQPAGAELQHYRRPRRRGEAARLGTCPRRRGRLTGQRTTWPRTGRSPRRCTA